MGPRAIENEALPIRQSLELNRSHIHFQRLPGTREEGKLVAETLGVQPWVGEKVLESYIKSYRSPHILHIATHGFFLPDQKNEMNTNNPRVGITSTMNNTAEVAMNRLSGQNLENPMLRSGLALAGANTWLQQGLLPKEAEDGILTAEDVSGMDLSNTQLVVLSACETGLGQVLTGEGVYGLRRAFVLAGAQTLVMSLWKVPDEQTKELMVDFYQRMLSGRSRAEALRQSQLAMRKQYSDPYYWGAFICQGDPNPLPYQGGKYGEQHGPPLSLTIESLKKALLMYEQLQDKPNMAKQYESIGAFLFKMQNLEDALNYYNKALQAYVQLNDNKGMAEVYTLIAELYKTNDIQKALDYYNKALVIYEKLHNKMELKIVYEDMGNLFYRVGKFEEALDYYNKTLQICTELGDKKGMANVFVNIGSLVSSNYKSEEALDYYKRAIQIYEEFHDKEGMANAYGKIGYLLDRNRDFNEALEFHKKALQIHEEVQDKNGMAMDSTNIGVVLEEMNQYEEAIDFSKRALQMYIDMQDKVHMASNYNNIGVLLENMNKFEEALSYHDNALQIREVLGDKQKIADSYANIGKLLARKGDLEGGCSYLKRALQLREELKDRVGMGMDYLILSQTLFDMGEFQEALESTSRGLVALQELQQETGYRDPVIERLKQMDSLLQRNKK